MYSSLRKCAKDLEKTRQLIRIKSEVDPDLEMAEIHRRFYDAKGPAILFENVKGSPFQAISNIYGTIDRTAFIFRNTIDKVKKVIELKADPTNVLRKPFRYIGAPFTALKALPGKSWLKPDIAKNRCRIDQLPLIKSWPDDGGAFVTLPQVFTLPPGSDRIMQSNLGMYRIQLDGNEYKTNEEIGLHYQLHRGIGVHHQMYNESNEDFKISVFIGGPPSHALSAIMPLPEGLSELTFAGMLAGKRFKYYKDQLGHILSSDADFVITGTLIMDKKMPEGPFGDHLGYYSLEHDFPVMRVDNVYHRSNPLWHFTVVGRPPQEDSSFGWMIHELVEELTPTEFPGLVELNAVDAAGVHPLLIAVGQERYMPFRDQKPEEILTIANRLLGSGQTSLAKFLWIAAEDKESPVHTHDIGAFFSHMLRKVDWHRDLHFQTKTTIDTLDYSGDGWNAGSKVVVAACGPDLRQLDTELPKDFHSKNIIDAHVARPGVLGLQLSAFKDYENAKVEIEKLASELSQYDLEGLPLIILCDDSRFLAQTLNNFLWVSFTRANPSHDIYGIDSFTEFKHWGCRGSLIIDARIKPHHAPELIPDSKVAERVDKLFAKGGELYGVL